MTFHLNIEGFLETLPIMGYGMLGIFLVMFIIYLSIILLLKIFGEKQKPGEDGKKA